VSALRVDHVTIDVPDLAAGVDAYRRLGFDLRGAVAYNAEDFLELKVGPADGISDIATTDKPSSSVPGTHPNGVYKLERVYVAVADLAAAVKEWRRKLGLPEPKMERGTVIMADMAVFQLGPVGLTLAHPYAPGVAADALKTRGAGPFQLLYRTKSMDAAAKWLSDHGVPPPARGVRNTGEQAMLVSPAQACGAYVGFVGPA
jgi:hypothetical protein